jgi:predicted O-methyltransferase YrrM
MYWENIKGSFTFQFIYNNMVNTFDNAVFVEIGTYKGQSAVFMVEKIKELKKNIKFYTIDLFVNPQGYENDADVKSGTLLQKYYQNIEPVKDYINTIIGDSTKVHEQFENESLDFVFIDGDHSYKGVKKDLAGWFPKIKKGGIMAGHDYNELSCGVRQAVDEFFTFSAQSYIGGCWIFYK